MDPFSCDNSHLVGPPTGLTGRHESRPPVPSSSSSSASASAEPPLCHPQISNLSLAPPLLYISVHDSLICCLSSVLSSLPACQSFAFRTLQRRGDDATPRWPGFLSIVFTPLTTVTNPVRQPVTAEPAEQSKASPSSN